MAFADLADSPWPTIHGNRSLDQVTDLNGSTSGTPDGPNARAGVVVDEKWTIRRTLRGIGACIVNVSVGTDGSLYYVSDGYLWKFDPDTGANLEREVALLPSTDTFAINQPMVTREGSDDKIYVATRGRITKYNEDLSVDTGWSGDGVVELSYYNMDEGEDVELLAAGGMVHSAQSDAILFVAQGPYETGEPGGTWAYALSPSTGAILSSFDVADALVGMDEFDDYLDYPQVATNNTASVGPHPNNTGNELLYILSIDHLSAIEFDTSTRTFQSSLEWVAQYYDPSGSTGAKVARQSGSSPTVSDDGNRVYIVTGRDASPGPGSTTVNPFIQSYNTSTGALEARSDALPAKSTGSAVVHNDSARGGNMVYASVAGGSVYGFLETRGTGGTSDSFSCRWKTHPDYEVTGANLGLAGKMLYAPFRIPNQLGQKGYAGGFDTSAAHLDCNTAQACGASSCTGATPNWQYNMGSGAIDACTRSLSYEGGEAQVYFGTGSKLFSFEETAAP